MRLPLNRDEKKFYDFNNTALYSPLCYVPASAGIFMAKWFVTPLQTFYIARFANLFFWIWIIFLSIKLLPVFKWLFTFLALLPMSLFVNMSLSADVVTNAVCFLFISLILNYSFSSSNLGTKPIFLLCLLAFLVTSIKSVYVPLLVLLFVIPASRFKNKKEYFIKLSLPFLTGIISFFVWNQLLTSLYISYENYNELYRDGAALVNGADMHRQIQYILHTDNEYYLFNVLLKSFLAAFDMYFPGYIGIFGWLQLPLPWWLVYVSYAVIFTISLGDNVSAIHITWRQKFLFGAVFVLIVLLLFISQHLIWDQIGDDKIMNIQGRYLIPFFLCFLFCSTITTLTSKKLLLLFRLSLLFFCYFSHCNFYSQGIFNLFRLRVLLT